MIVTLSELTTSGWLAELDLSLAQLSHSFLIILLILLKASIRNCAVSFTFSGQFKTTLNTEISGVLILLSYDILMLL